MSWKYTNRKRRFEDRDERDFFENPFNFGFRFGFQDVDEMIDSMFKTAYSLEENMKPNANTIYYGYQVNIGPDGKPHVREFGNVRPTKKGTFELGSREPFVDVVLDNKENVLKVVAEMPGVQKQDIKLQATEEALSIKAESKERNYDTSVPLDTQVDPGTARASYNNGILEVTLRLKSQPKQNGHTINVD